LSVFFPVVMVVLTRYVIIANTKGKSTPAYIVAVSFLLFPLGYLLVNFEARYIWYMLPLSMLAGGLFYQNHISGRGTVFSKVFPWVFALSFLVYPVWGMASMYNEGRAEHQIAGQLSQLHIHGSFATMAKPGKETQRVERLAYFSSNQYYSLTRDIDSPQVLLREMRRYHVSYYFTYGEAGYNPLTDEQGRPFPEITNGSIKGLKVYIVNQ